MFDIIVFSGFFLVV